jgi:hypothetical protein
MIKEGTDILRMRLSTLHIPSNAGRPHFQKAKAPKIRKGFKRQPEAFSSNTLITCFISQPLISKSFFKKLCQKRLCILT